MKKNHPPSRPKFSPTLPRAPRITRRRTTAEETTAYRKQHSCETTLLTLVEEWRQAIDKKELTTVLSMDMSKAFDSLCHALTIKKLDAYGFGSGALKMMRSFFDGRLNRVKRYSNTDVQS